jgi:sulfite exporter TauE/SafE
MKLADDENKVAEYFFRKSGDVANVTVLTNRRIVIVYGNAEESYPLSKITAVKTIYNRHWKLVILGAMLALIGVAVIRSSAVAGLLGVAAGAGLIYLGWLGRTNLLIGQMGGNKHYSVTGQAKQGMKDFIEVVNGKLA